MDDLRSEQGLMGKLALVWLLILALVVITAVDAVAIVSTRIHLSNLATKAASDGAVAWRETHDVGRTCEAALSAVHTEDAAAKVGRNGCKVDQGTGFVTISVHKAAPTILAGRLSITKPYATVTDTETNGPPSV